MAHLTSNLLHFPVINRGYVKYLDKDSPIQYRVFYRTKYLPVVIQQISFENVGKGMCNVGFCRSAESETDLPAERQVELPLGNTSSLSTMVKVLKTWSVTVTGSFPNAEKLASTQSIDLMWEICQLGNATQR